MAIRPVFRLVLPPALALATCLALGPAAAAQRVELRVAATTDVHGRLRGWDYSTGREDPVRGLSRVATVVDSLRSASRNRVILVDAGDLLQGNAMTFVAGRIDSLAPHPVIAAMNVLRYDAAAIGNHEYNYGVDLLDRAIAQARFPFLAANARRLDGKPAYPGRTMVTRAGIKVAIIGVTNPGSMVWDRDNLRNRVAVDDIVAALPPQIAAARAEGANAVVVVAHAGLETVSSYDTVGTGLPSENPMARVAREVPGIDLIVIGHSHREVADSTIGGVRIIQARNWATSVAVATLAFERRDGAWRIAQTRGEVIPVRGVRERADIVRLVDRAHRAAIGYATTVVGQTSTQWRSDSARFKDLAITDFVAEVQRKVAGTELSIASVFSQEARFEPGPITVERMVDLYPYENTLRGLRLTAAQLRAFLEHSARYYVVDLDADGVPRVSTDRTIPGYNVDHLAGLDYTIDLSRPIGQRVSGFSRNGRAVPDTATFTVALNSYRAGGGGGYDMLRGAPVVYEGSAEIRTLLIEEIQRKGRIEPAEYFTANWQILPPARSLRVIGINDFHGALVKRPDGNAGNRGGAAELATAIKQARAECAPLCVSVVLNGGDLFQGTPASNLSYGAPVSAVLNAIGVDAHALGNHEFDWGQDTLRARLAELNAPVLGANVTMADGRDADWVHDDLMIERGGFKIGIIGIADPATPRTTMARYVADLRFAEPAPIVAARAASLRARGAAFVLLVGHIGGFCQRDNPDDCRGEIFEIARELPRGAIDAIVSGHTHSEIRTVVNGMPISQARVSGRAIGIIDIPLSGGSHATSRRPEVRAVVSDSLVPDPAVAAIVAEAWNRVEGRINAAVTTTDVEWAREGEVLREQYPLGNLIADAQRAAGRADIAVMNNGGIRVAIRPGAVSWGDLYEVQPFANRLFVLTARGDAIRRYLEQRVSSNNPRWHLSGVTVLFDTLAAAGNRIREVRMADGRLMQGNRTYRIVMTDFLSNGGDGSSRIDGATTEDLSILDLDALIAHIRAMPGGVLVQTDALKTPRIRPVAR
jgi:2',3'-cyclic-nucleotide 2'-phosphodiesterase/3'-nucleotidase/5'-nucleotidase